METKEASRSLIFSNTHSGHLTFSCKPFSYASYQIPQRVHTVVPWKKCSVATGHQLSLKRIPFRNDFEIFYEKFKRHVHTFGTARVDWGKHGQSILSPYARSFGDRFGEIPKMLIMHICLLLTQILENDTFV